MSVKDLFCTPEQGRRLAELVPELKYTMIWVYTGWEAIPMPFSSGYKQHHKDPALTLQELRDVAKDIRIRTTNDYWVYTQKVFNSTAPELAAWVIERLEGQS